jgi:hypothetical protein
MMGKERETEKYFRLGKLINLVCSIDTEEIFGFPNTYFEECVEISIGRGDHQNTQQK